VKRLAVFSDLHADVHALRDALSQIERLGCDAIVCAGDLIDYGVCPEETLQLLMQRGIPCIRGNHDRWATHDKRFASEWGMTPKAMKFLRTLLVSWSAEIEGVRVAVWHARPWSDMNGIDPDISDDDATTLLDAAACDVLIVGHTHLAFERRVVDGRMICNPGALLRDPAEPLDVPARGTFGVLELPSKTFTVRSAKTGEIEASSGTPAPWKLVDGMWRRT